ncbi:MAG: hypothetical protein IJ759_07105 [Bacteroidales bacterium]|nr:hypothetical protein [Bacteroidales bacterium]
MKKTILAIMMLGLSTTLMSCNSGNTDSKTESSAETTVETTEAESNEAASAKKIKKSVVKEGDFNEKNEETVTTIEYNQEGQKIKESQVTKE